MVMCGNTSSVTRHKASRMACCGPSHRWPCEHSVSPAQKFPEGYQEPWHSHSSTYHAVLVKGELRSRSPEGGPEPERALGPGSYIVQPGGGTHAEVNTGAGELLAMVYFDGPVDFVPAE